MPADAKTYPLAGRKFSRVKLGNISLDHVPPDGSRHISFSCEVQLEDYTGGREGPSAMFWLSVPCADDMTIAGFEAAAISRANDMIQALSIATIENLTSVKEQTKAIASEINTIEDD